MQCFPTLTLNMVLSGYFQQCLGKLIVMCAQCFAPIPGCSILVNTGIDVSPIPQTGLRWHDIPGKNMLTSRTSCLDDFCDEAPDNKQSSMKTSLPSTQKTNAHGRKHVQHLQHNHPKIASTSVFFTQSNKACWSH